MLVILSPELPPNQEGSLVELHCRTRLRNHLRLSSCLPGLHPTPALQSKTQSGHNLQWRLQRVKRRKDQKTSVSGSHDEKGDLWDNSFASNVSLRNKEYLELDERHAPPETQTTVQGGGRMAFPAVFMGPRGQERSRAEEPVVLNAIGKTTRVEQSAM